MAGIVDDSPVGCGGKVAEILERLCERRQLGVVKLPNLAESHGSQRASNGLVDCRIRERRHGLIGAVSYDEGDPTLRESRAVGGSLTFGNERGKARKTLLRLALRTLVVRGLATLVLRSRLVVR